MTKVNMWKFSNDPKEGSKYGIILFLLLLYLLERVFLISDKETNKGKKRTGKAISFCKEYAMNQVG